ncbi:MAG: phosphatidic acid phosphatase, partial [Flavobacteriaceae bacterium]|nr:phosphatidic acid phosphatase [Flavobacteriaceae bacterium]
MKKIIYFLALGLCIACSEKKPIEISPDDLHGSIDQVTDIMIHDIFSPPVASRIFAYPNIAAYEIIALGNPGYKSLAGQLEGLTPIPAPDGENTVNPELAALIANMELSKKLIFSEDRMEKFQDSLYGKWRALNETEFEASKSYGLTVADHIASWMDKDNYKQTRTMPKFTVDTEEPGRWQPTPPSYMDGIEPHWNKIRPFVLDSAQQFTPPPPPDYSMEEDSQFFKELKEVYDISEKITENGDETEEVQFAKFWDCNP